MSQAHFLIGNLLTQVTQTSALKVIVDECTFRNDFFFKRRVTSADIASGRAKPKQRYITEHKTREFNYYDRGTNMFPTGLLGKVMKKLDTLRIKFTFKDIRAKPKVEGIDLYEPIELRKEYQVEAVEKMLKWGRGLIHQAPNSGKTILGIYVTAQLGVKTLYVVPNKTLLSQTYNDFKKYLPEYVGKIGDGIFEPSFITIATVQSLWLHRKDEGYKDLFRSIKCVFFDEAHHISFSNKKGGIPWNTWYMIAMALPNAYYRFGLTASPDERGSLQRGLLEAATGPKIHRVTQQQLKEWGYSTPAHVKMIKYKFESTEDFEDWHDAYNKLIYDSRDFNEYVSNIVNKYVDSGNSVFVILTRVKTQLALLQEYLPDGTFLQGKSTTQKREEAKELFENNGCTLMLSTIHGEGVNLPSMDVLIIPCGNKSKKLAIQRSGRAVRKKEGKESVLIIDFMFEGEKYTHKHSLERRRQYLKEGFDVELVDSSLFS